MTVDHLKSLGTSGSAGFDNTRVARDYHGVGFRECAAEVSRYLVSVEGMDVQDPLRIRLMSHLQMFIAQKSPPTQPNYYQNYPPQPNYYSEFDPFYAGSQRQAHSSTPTNYTMTMTASAPIGFTASVQANPLIPYHPAPVTSSPEATNPSSSPNYANLTNSKPYRPWGAEMPAC